jgi:hypothetical protein
MAGGKGKSSGGKSSGGKTGVEGPKKQQSHSARAGLQVRRVSIVYSCAFACRYLCDKRAHPVSSVYTPPTQRVLPDIPQLQSVFAPTVAAWCAATAASSPRAPRVDGGNRAHQTTRCFAGRRRRRPGAGLDARCHERASLATLSFLFCDVSSPADPSRSSSLAAVSSVS